MTTEDDFQAALDANSDDWQTRLVFADFLEERGDGRAAGYRALGMLRVRPLPRSCGVIYYYLAARYLESKAVCSHLYANGLPVDWFDALDIPHKSTDWESRPGDRAGIEWKFAPSPMEISIANATMWLSRHAAEGAACRAFAKLSADRRRELLSPSLTGAPS